MPESPDIALASDEDFASIHVLDSHLSDGTLREKLRRGEVLLARSGNDIVACLRWGLFWDELPFVYFLQVLEGHRRQGIGRALTIAWEMQMRSQGHVAALTSTLSDEQGQHFWRAMGYSDCGVLLLPGEAAELLLRKAL